MYEYKYSEELRAQLLELSSAFEQGGQVLVEALANSSSELLQALQTEMSTMDGSFAGTAQYKEGLESLNLLIENTRLQKEEQDALNESLQETGAIFNNFTESMADSIDGQQEIAELWNQMVENTQEVGEGGLFSINLDEMDELNEYLRENAEAMYAYDFEGRRYDVGDKLGFLEATVEYALRKEELRDGFIEYLKTII